MRRREVIKLLTGAAIAAGPGAPIARAEPKVFRLGTLVPGAPLDQKNRLAAVLLKALEQLGYALGKNSDVGRAGSGW